MYNAVFGTRGLKKSLQNILYLLSESTYSAEVLKTLKRILKIRKNNYGKKLLRLYQEKTKNLEAIKFTFSKNETSVFGDNKYFITWDDNRVVYKLTSSQFVSFSSKLLKGFIDNLEYNSIVKFESNQTVSQYKKEDVEAISQADCMYIHIMTDEKTKKFVIKKSIIRRVCVTYINMLHEKNIDGWYYIQ
ncbi:hypothetical protein ESA94_03110 [Lacibacter luteus]|uniref:Uncharacterized protein n=1 Tax=Lacibacter luteus TaxID=2508719 RepID=A0A4Q1CLZ6_9BACT|nr:hypothetical protein [Lacibacter luteus]RXK62020.1 hypothetical protein ESA94_03110 [Lacibacter luteus]